MCSLCKEKMLRVLVRENGGWGFVRSETLFKSALLHSNRRYGTGWVDAFAVKQARRER